MKSRFYSFLPVFLCGLAIPISMFMWLGNLAFSKFWSHPEYDGKWELNYKIKSFLILLILLQKNGSFHR